jgi:transposase
MKPKVDEATKRRIRGGRMLLAGKKPSEVARAVGVSRQTAYSWKAVIEDGGGIEALRNLSRGGRPGNLSDQDKQWLTQALIDGPTAHGFGTELWTLKRVRILIEKRFGVRFSQVHVWRLLGQLGFSNQKPDKRALERDEQAIARWRRSRWPALKKKPGARAA